MIRKPKLSVAIVMFIAMFVLGSTLNLHAATLAGVTLPDTVQIESTTLVLNGQGLRTKFMVKVYVAGLYLEHKSSDPNAINKAEVPKRIVMQFVHNASKSQLVDGFGEDFKENSPEAMQTIQPEIDRFLGALEPVKEGDQLVFSYLPGKGTTFAFNGKDKLSIAPAAFAQVLFSVWLGPKPPNAGLKRGLLGQ
jgi:hypothetical protein